MVFDHLSGEAVFAICSEYVDSAGFHFWPGFVRVPASLVEGARVAVAAGSGGFLLEWARGEGA